MGRVWQPDLLVSLVFEREQGELVARLAVDDPDRRLVEVELTGDEVARLLAGEVVAVAGEVAAAETVGVDEPGGEEPRPDVPTLTVVEQEAAVELDAVEQDVPAAAGGVRRARRRASGGHGADRACDRGGARGRGGGVRAGPVA